MDDHLCADTLEYSINIRSLTVKTNTNLCGRNKLSCAGSVRIHSFPWSSDLFTASGATVTSCDLSLPWQFGLNQMKWMLPAAVHFIQSSCATSHVRTISILHLLIRSMSRIAQDASDGRRGSGGTRLSLTCGVTLPLITMVCNEMEFAGCSQRHPILSPDRTLQR